MTNEKNDNSMTYIEIPVVGIGASAGGLDALKKFFDAMPDDPELAFVLVQHLDPTHESMMVDLLKRHTNMNVIQVVNDTPVEPNTLYVIPPNRDLSIARRRLMLSEPAQRRGFRLPIDFFFNSLAEDVKDRAIGIILSGTGSDGTLGIKAIKQNGGMTMVQSPKEAQYDGMPVSAVSTGAIDYVLPAGDIPDALLKYIQHSYMRGRFGMDPEREQQDVDINTVLAVMNVQLGHNFHHYKKNTLMRRIQRRMALRQLESMSDYVQFLRNNRDETAELFNDMLIGVTRFFREEESWKELAEQVIPEIIARKKNDLPIRIWVPGCATGEEAYTLAILFHEHLLKAGISPEVQIFATDIDARALETARNGVYPESIQTDVSAPRLKEFFTTEDGFYKVSYRIRDNIIFSQQNLISDPPFSKLDLISCRNLLIYLEADIQDRVIELFHFALQKNGYLLLGGSETIGRHSALFESISQKWRIFKRLEAIQRNRPSFPILPDRKHWYPSYSSHAGDDKQTVRLGEVMQKTLIQLFAPTALLVDKRHHILYHFGDTVNYLSFPSGEPTNDLFAVLREGLVNRVRSAIQRANREQKSCTVSDATVKRNGNFARVQFSVYPVKNVGENEEVMLITFADEPVEQPRTEPSRQNISAEEENIVQQLEYELSATREDLQNTIEELETSNEELKASNEEILSMNEELQSSNEELETSKEELQSLNEEMSTVNSELQEKVFTLEKTNDDLTNLINSTKAASVFLDTRFCIKFFTPPAKELFRLIAMDIGRELTDITPKTNDVNLRRDAEDVLNSLKSSTVEIRNDEGNWFTRKIFPYRTSDNRIEGVVITYENISHLKRIQLALESERDKATQYFNLANVIFVALDSQGKIEMVNRKACETFGYAEGELVGMNWFTVALPATVQEKMRMVHQQIIKGDFQSYKYVENEVILKSGDRRKIAWYNSVITNTDGNITGTISAGEDITESDAMAQQIQETQLQITHLLNHTSSILYQYSPTHGGIYYQGNTECIVGYSIETLLTSPHLWYDNIHPDDSEAVLELLKSTTPGKTIEIQYRFKHQASHWIWLQDRFVAVEKDGERQLHGAVTEITASRAFEKLATQTLNNGGTLTESDDDIVLFLNPKREIKWVNKYGLRQRSGEIDISSGVRCIEYFHRSEEDCERCPVFHAISTGDEQNDVIDAADGQNWQIKAIPVKDGQDISGVVAILHKQRS